VMPPEAVSPTSGATRSPDVDAGPTGEDGTTGRVGGAGRIGRVGWVDAAKGLCILLVVSGHAIITLNNNGYATGAWEHINMLIGPVRMPLFFLLSGLFAAKALSESWRKFADRRVWIMVWLFVLWVPIREIWLSLIPDTNVGHSGDIPAPRGADPQNWLPMLENIGRSVLGPPSYLWFLYALALFAVLSKLTRRVPPVVQIVVAGAVSMLSPMAGFGWPWNDILHTYVFYLLGMYAAPWIHRMARMRSLWIIGGSTALYTVVALWVDATNDHFLIGLNGPLKVFLASVGIIAVISAFSYMESWRIMVPFSKVGSRTLPVFLMHIMVLATVIFVFNLLLPADPGLPLQPLILGVIAVVLSLGLHKVLTASGFAWLFSRPQWLRRRYLSVE
ncbi:MAG: acyltransferase family protein, partial [Corynebacterium sp.]|nr:acyltransferase family protein [Corynebacterium sp.]